MGTQDFLASLDFLINERTTRSTYFHAARPFGPLGLTDKPVILLPAPVELDKETVATSSPTYRPRTGGTNSTATVPPRSLPYR